MPSKWPENMKSKEVILNVEEARCRVCGNELVIRKDRIHQAFLPSFLYDSATTLSFCQ
jgi:uncharacterized protein with PIN domain